MRWKIAIAVALAAGAVWTGLWVDRSQSAGRETTQLIDSRVAYWRARVQGEVPVGTPKAAAIRWLQAVTGDHREDWYFGDGWAVTMEDVKAVPPTLLCGDAHIDISMTLGPDGTVAKRDASAMGICF